MARTCIITGKTRTKGTSFTVVVSRRRAVVLVPHVPKVTRRDFRPNLQRVRVVLPSGRLSVFGVSAKALKAGKVQKAL